MDEKNSISDKKSGRTISIAIVGGAIIAVLLVLSSIWINQRGQKDAVVAAHIVMEQYLRELTDRREQVLTARINDRINDLQAVLQTLTPYDLQNVETLSLFLGRMKAARPWASSAWVTSVSA